MLRDSEQGFVLAMPLEFLKANRSDAEEKALRGKKGGGAGCCWHSRKEEFRGGKGIVAR